MAGIYNEQKGKLLIVGVFQRYECKLNQKENA